MISKKIIMGATLLTFASSAAPMVQGLTITANESTAVQTRAHGDKAYGYLYTINNSNRKRAAFTTTSKVQSVTNKKATTYNLNGGTSTKKFSTLFFLPNGAIKAGNKVTKGALVYRGTSYNFDMPQGMSFDSKGNLYIIYSMGKSKTLPSLVLDKIFVLRIPKSEVSYYSKAANSKKLAEQKGKYAYQVKNYILNLLNKNKIQISSIRDDVPHGALLSTAGSTAYVMSNKNKNKTTMQLLRLNTTKKNGKLTWSTLATGTYKTVDIPSAVKANVATNYVQVNSTMGYFIFSNPFGKGQDYGYTIYQVKKNGSKLSVTREPFTFHDMLGNNKTAPALQGLSYDAKTKNLVLLSDGAWFSVNLPATIQASQKLYGLNSFTDRMYSLRGVATNKYQEILATKYGLDNEDMQSFNMSWTRYDSKQEIEQMAFNGNKQYLLGVSRNQILVSK